MRFAIASDLHCHSPRDRARSFLISGVARPARLDPVASLIDLIGQTPDLSASALLCPGDLCDACDMRGIDDGFAAVRAIATALGAARTITTIGNHDVDSRQLHGTNPFDPVRRNPNAVPTGSAAASAAYWRDGFTIETDSDWAVLIVNSAADHTSLELARRGAVSTETLLGIERALQLIPASVGVRLAVVHHHPHLHEDLGLGTNDVMVNGSLLLSLLERFGFQLVVHGHKHHPKLSYAAGGGASPAVLASGSLAAIATPVLSTNARNLFHLVQLDFDALPFCHGRGVIRTWEFNAGRGWHPSTAQSAGFPHKSGFGCRLPPRDIADQVIELARGTRIRWQEVLSRLPHVEHVLPTDLKSCFDDLLARHSVQVHRDDFGDPLELAA